MLENFREVLIRTIVWLCAIGTSMIKNSFINFLGLTVPLLAAIFCIPPTFSALGQSGAGLLLLIWTVINSSALLDFGLGRALTQILARSGTSETHSVVSIAFWFSVAIGAFFAAILFFCSELIAVHFGDASYAGIFEILSLSIPFIVATSVLRGILEANKKFLIINAIRVPTGTLNFAAPLLVVLIASPDVELMAWWLAAGRLATFFLFLVAAWPFAHSTLLKIQNLNESRELATSGGWMTISNVSGPVISLVERFIIGGQISLQAVTVYATPQELVSKLSIVPNAISIAIFPEVSKGGLDRRDLSEVYASCLSAVVCLTGVPTVFLFLFAHEILEIWIGADFALLATSALKLFAIGSFVGALAQIPFVVIQGRGGSRFTGILHFFEAIVVCAVLLVAVEKWSLAGALAVWIIRVLVDAALLFRRAQLYVAFPSFSKSWSGYAVCLGVLVCLPLGAVESVAVRCACVGAMSLVTLFGAWSLIGKRLQVKTNTNS